MELHPESDEILIARCLQGEGRAWERLVERYAPYIYTVVRNMIGGPTEEVEDVLQVVFTKLYSSLRRFDRRSSFRTWFTTLARNTCIDYMRGHIRHGEKEAHIEDIDEAIKARTNSDAIERTRDLAEILDLKAAIMKLPEDTRTLLYLRFYRDLSYKEIARITGRPQNVIPMMIARAVAKLRKLLISEQVASNKGGKIV